MNRQSNETVNLILRKVNEIQARVLAIERENVNAITLLVARMASIENAIVLLAETISRDTKKRTEKIKSLSDLLNKE